MSKVLKWLDNFWYHYKWHVIVVAFFVVVFGVSTAQMISKDSVDSYVMYAGPSAFTPNEISEIRNVFEIVSPDSNDDGEKYVEFVDITYLSDAKLMENKKLAEEGGIEYKPNMEFVYNSREKYRIQLAAGDAYLVLVDPETYMMDYGTGMFEKLEDIGIKTEKAYDEYSIRFKDTEFGSYFPIFNRIPDDTLICFRAMTVTAKARGKKEIQKYDNQLELFKEILAYEAEKPISSEE